MSISKVRKALEMSEAKIKYISLVNKAANGHKFLITKDEKSGKPKFELNGKIIKSENHEVVGIVYEPLVEDAHGNFMTAEEIQKAADWFNENGLGSDLQHNEEVQSGVNITKSWVVEEDTEINGTIVKAGTWLAQAEITDTDLWSKIEKGELTGWSMGGDGLFSTVDVEIENITKNVGNNIMKSLAKVFGLEFGEINKGAMKTAYEGKIQRSNFWDALWTLEEILYPVVDSWNWTREFETDDTKIREALEDFSTIIQDILKNEEPIQKSLSFPNTNSDGKIEKAGKKISSKNMEQIKTAHEALGKLIELDSEEGDDDMNAEEIKKAIADGIAAAMAPAPVVKEEEKLEDIITKAVNEQVNAIKKELGIEEDKEPSIADHVAKEVAKQMEPILRARGISKSLDDDISPEEGEVKKSVFSGIFGNTRGGN